MRPPVSVLLIRENAEQMTGSGCCGKLEGDSDVLGCGDIFEQARRHQRDLGVLHRAIRAFFPPVDGVEQVSCTIVDPRNQLYLAPKLWSDVWHYHPGLRAGLRTAVQWFSLPAVIVNGRVMSGRDFPPDPDTLCHAISQLLEQQEEVSAG